MNLNLLKTYLRVVETQNLSRTAEEFGISQPAVTKQIQWLEDKYGVMLLERYGRSLRPTEAGECLYQCAREVIRDMERTEREMQYWADSGQGSLALGASTIPGQYLLPRMIRQYKDAHPEINISLSISDSEKVYRQVAEHSLDIGLVGSWINHHQVEGFPWQKDELAVIAPADYRPGQEQVELTALTEEDWVIREKGSGTRQAMEELWYQAGLRQQQMRPVMEVGSTEAVVAMVEAGLGISIVSRLALGNGAGKRRCRELKIQGLNAGRQLYVIYPLQKARREAVNKFLDYLRSMAEPVD